MKNLLRDVSNCFRMFPQEEEINCVIVSAWGLLKVIDLSIVWWYLLSPMDSRGVFKLYDQITLLLVILDKGY